jgi:uncharacterized membrane protein YGL010W
VVPWSVSAESGQVKPLADQMAGYAAYHRTPGNKAVHFVFVPAIVWSLMVLLSIPRGPDLGGVTVRPSMVAAGLLLLYYLMLDYGLGVACVLLFTVLEGTAIQVADLGTDFALAIGGAVFVLSWIAQFVGHAAFEHRKPALMDNLLQVFVAPIFVVAEWAFALGMRKRLQEEVEMRIATVDLA